MLKIAIRPEWSLKVPGEAARPLPRLLQLLSAVDEEGNLLRAARRLGISYRHAWGLIRDSDAVFGAPLLVSGRGRAASLSALGNKLLWADKRIAARLSPLLDSLASELESELERTLSDARPVPRIHASHGFAIELLRDFLSARHSPVDLKYRACMEALASLARSNCEIAGIHAPLGALQPEVVRFYGKWLHPDAQTLIHLCTRRQGIMVAPDNPKGVASLACLARPGIRFVNRQFGSGTRILLELLLRQEKVDSAAITGYDSGELTHLAVAAYLASGMADAGFGVETAARRFQLKFIPIITERYFLACSNELIDSPLMILIREILASHQFRAAAGGLEGVDVTGAGRLVPMSEAFPDFAASWRARPKPPSRIARAH